VIEGFNAIPIFIAVVEQGSFSGAARVLGISKSAVSKRINQLEDQLAVRLLQRTTRQIKLTEAGEHYYQHAFQAYQAATNAIDAVTQLQEKPQGHLRLNVPMSFGRLHIAPLIPKFLQRYPDIHIDMVMDDKHVDLIEAGFDLAIRAGDLPDSSLIARKLVDCHSEICASPEYLAQQGTPKTPADLLSHNAILYSYSNNAQEWTLTNAEGSEIVVVSGNYQVNNSEALLEALLQDAGIGRLPTFVTGSEIRSGRLVNLFEQYQMPVKSIYAVFPERAYMPAKVRVFLDFIVDCFGEDNPYWDQR